MVKRILQVVSVVVLIGLIGAGVLWVMGSKTYIHLSQVEVKGTPAEVFRHCTEPELVKQWMAGVTRIEPLTEGGRRVGAEARIVIVDRGREFVLHETITAFEADRQLSNRLVSDEFEAEQRLEISMEDDAAPENGVVTVRANLAVRYRGLNRLLAPFLEGEVQRRLEGNLERLKDLLEPAPAEGV